MTDIEELQHLLDVMKKFDLPVSPILEFAIKDKIDSLSESHNSVVGNVISKPAPQQTATAPNSHIGKKTLIRVIRTDGTKIEYEKTTQTLSNTIKEIGAKKVFELKIPMDGMHLVTIGGNPQYPSAQYDVGDGFFVNTHSCTAAKKRQLERIFSALNLDWKVEIVKRN